jgi:conjugal transfer pilin signal peptidase TrbI
MARDRPGITTVTTPRATAALRPLLAAASDELRRWWFVYAPLAALWTLALWRLFVEPAPKLPLLFNWTPSLPYLVAWRVAPQAAWPRGDLVLYRFDGTAQQAYPGLAGQPFFKVVRGLPGDRITVVDRIVHINGVAVGRAKSHTFDGRPLEPIAPGDVPAGFLYVQGTSPDSFDSRYAASGLVRAEQVLGRVRPLW